jgi:agmatine deiminase
MKALPTDTASDSGATLRRMPAEWEPHAATWLAWPHYHNDWPGKFETIPWVFAEIIRYLARSERVELIVNDAAAERGARKVLDQANALSRNVRFHRWPTNRVWTRDSGCTFVLPPNSLPLEGAGNAPGRGTAPPPHRLGAVKWRFNAWAKYSNWQRDEKIGSLMARAAGAEEIRSTFGKQRVVLEGGSIDGNGLGTLLTTEECLLSKVQQRNPGLKRADYEKIFSQDLAGFRHRRR